MDPKIISYAGILVAVFVLSWAIISLLNPSAASKPKYSVTAAQNADNGCGDMADLSNVQHLSHHPDQFGNCIRQVDSKVFEQATGQKKEDYMKANNII